MSTKRKSQKLSESQSFNALNDAFGKPPRWKQKENAAKKRRQRKIKEMVDSVKLIGDDSNEFNEDVFDSLFDEKEKNEQLMTTNKYNFDEQMSETLQKKKKRKRLSKKRRKKVFESAQESPTKKQKLNNDEDEFNDSDFKDQGVMIQTVHSTKSKVPKTSSSSKQATIKQQKQSILAKKKEIISQIHRFELTALMIEGIPRNYDESKLSKYLLNLCNIECEDIHLFHNKIDETKLGKAIFTFLSPNNCAISYKYLFEQQLTPNCILSIKPISNRYHNHIKFDETTSNKKHKKQKQPKSKVLKLSNLHWTTSQKDILHFFDGVRGAKIINIHETSQGFTNGNAKIEFENSKIANDALHKLNGHKLSNRKVRIEHAISREIFALDGKDFKDETMKIAVFNISADIEENDLREFIISKMCKECLIDIHLIHHLKLFTTGYAFVTFESFALCNEAVQCLNNAILGDRALRVVWSKPSKMYKLRTALKGKTKIISFTNLKYNVNEDDIRQFIGDKCSDCVVSKVQIFENAKGFRYGMAKIWLEEYEHASMIVDVLNGELLNGRKVNMNYWEDKSQKGGEKKKEKNRWKSKGKKSNWNDEWFRRNVDKNANGVEISGEKKNIKVPQRLLEQIL